MAISCVVFHFWPIWKEPSQEFCRGGQSKTFSLCVESLILVCLPRFYPLFTRPEEQCGNQWRSERQKLQKAKHRSNPNWATYPLNRKHELNSTSVSALRIKQLPRELQNVLFDTRPHLWQFSNLRFQQSIFCWIGRGSYASVVAERFNGSKAIVWHEYHRPKYHTILTVEVPP